MAEEQQDVETLKKRGRRRLVGAVALVLLAVIVLPMVFDPEPKSTLPPVSVRIPGENETPFAPKLPAKPAAKAEPAPGARGEYVIQVGAFSRPHATGAARRGRLRARLRRHPGGGGAARRAHHQVHQGLGAAQPEPLARRALRAAARPLDRRRARHGGRPHLAAAQARLDQLRHRLFAGADGGAAQALAAAGVRAALAISLTVNHTGE